jgi:hypothetical protein
MVPAVAGTDNLNLDSRSYDDLGNLPAPLAAPMALQRPGRSKVNAQFFSDAGTALRAAGRRPVRKLSLFVEGRDDTYCKGVLGIYGSYWSSVWIDDANDHMAVKSCESLIFVLY